MLMTELPMFENRAYLCKSSQIVLDNRLYCKSVFYKPTNNKCIISNIIPQNFKWQSHQLSNGTIITVILQISNSMFFKNSNGKSYIMDEYWGKSANVHSTYFYPIQSSPISAWLQLTWRAKSLKHPIVLMVEWGNGRISYSWRKGKGQSKVSYSWLTLFYCWVQFSDWTRISISSHIAPNNHFCTFW